MAREEGRKEAWTCRAGPAVALISALVVYYAMVLPVSRLLRLLERSKATITRDCPECTMSIPMAARRCPECTAEIAPATERPQPVR
jgi:large conductance mechanosensitive channel